ncbi:MAG TPA: diguanylate cyclase [Candidatus Binatia bacterium]|nr:diguanylate cyclase [Candidatus Binatia bacterium]
MSDLERRLRELTVLHATLRALTSTLDLTRILATVLEQAKQVTAAEALSLLLYDPDRDELVFAATETLEENALARREPRLPPAVGGLVSPERLVVPVRDEDRVLGTIDLRRRWDGRPFDDADRRRAAAVAAELAARGPELERLAQEPEALHEVFARLAAAVPSQEATLVVYDLERRELAFRVSHELRNGVIDGVRLRVGQGIAGWVAAHREAVRLDDASRDPRHDPEIARRTGLVPHSMLCVPMVHHDTLHGVVQVINKLDGSAFDDDELRLVQTLADHAAIAIENASLYRRAQQAALTDDLTGLGNTRHFNETLAALVARGGPLSLLVIDLNGLRAVVDRHGHLGGNSVIAAVGRMIGARLRPGDVGARFGGDEFVVVLPATGTETARAIAEGLREAIAACPVPDAPEAQLGASVGVATFPEHARSADDLFRAADAAMFVVKRGPKGGVAVASPPISA